MKVKVFIACILVTLLVVMRKECGFSAGVVNIHKSASQPIMWGTQSFCYRIL